MVRRRRRRCSGSTTPRSARRRSPRRHQPGGHGGSPTSVSATVRAVPSRWSTAATGSHRSRGASPRRCRRDSPSRSHHGPGGSFDRVGIADPVSSMRPFVTRHRWLSTSPDSGFRKAVVVQRRDGGDVVTVRGLLFTRVGSRSSRGDDDRTARARGSTCSPTSSAWSSTSRSERRTRAALAARARPARGVARRRSPGVTVRDFSSLDTARRARHRVAASCSANLVGFEHLDHPPPPGELLGDHIGATACRSRRPPGRPSCSATTATAVPNWPRRPLTAHPRRPHGGAHHGATFLDRARRPPATPSARSKPSGRRTGSPVTSTERTLPTRKVRSPASVSATRYQTEPFSTRPKRVDDALCRGAGPVAVAEAHLYARRRRRAATRRGGPDAGPWSCPTSPDRASPPTRPPRRRRGTSRATPAPTCAARPWPRASPPPRARRP